MLIGKACRITLFVKLIPAAKKLARALPICFVPLGHKSASNHFGGNTSGYTPRVKPNKSHNIFELTLPPCAGIAHAAPNSQLVGLCWGSIAGNINFATNGGSGGFGGTTGATAGTSSTTGAGSSGVGVGAGLGEGVGVVSSRMISGVTGTMTTGAGTLTVTGAIGVIGAGIPGAGTLTVITGEKVISCNCGGAGQAGATLTIGTGQASGFGKVGVNSGTG